MTLTQSPDAPATAAALNRPAIAVNNRSAKRLQSGHPWVYANELDMASVPKDLAAGDLVRLVAASGADLGTALFNRHSLIAARVISSSNKVPIDVAFLQDRLARALQLRERLFDAPYYRLVHAEADGLPGLVIDRFGDSCVVQINSAGMERLQEPLLEALDTLLTPERIILRKDAPARRQEGLERSVEIAKGSLDGPIALMENDGHFFADLEGGQKTGWFYDQRDNRAWCASLARDVRVFDGFCFSGGFAVTAARAGAKSVVALDSSEPALELAQQAAAHNDVTDRCSFHKSDVMAGLRTLITEGESFDLVMVDPPAFVKSKRDLKSGLKGYRKLARLAAQAVAPGGMLFMASCSHNVGEAVFLETVAGGLIDAGRQGRVIRRAGAAGDHPLHPALPESAYLKALGVALD